MSEDSLYFTGTITEIMPRGIFRVKLENDHVILGHLSGKMRINKIHLTPGDRVEVEMTVYDLTKGRIYRRL